MFSSTDNYLYDYTRTLVKYGSNHLTVDDPSTSPEKIRSVMSEVFPEVRCARMTVDVSGSTRYIEFHARGGDEEDDMCVKLPTARVPAPPRKAPVYVRIGDEYVNKGNYQHLVGKLGKVLYTIEEMKTETQRKILK